MLQQLYYMKQYFGAKYLSFTMHRSIEKKYSGDHSVLYGVHCTFIQLQSCNCSEYTIII